MLDLVILALAGVLENDPSASVDNILSGPIVIAIRVPCREFIVLRHWIFDTVTLDGALDVAGRSLKWKFRSMDADDNKAFVLVGFV